MNTSRPLAAAALSLTLVLTASACAGKSDNDRRSPEEAAGDLVTTTEPGTQQVDEITWALYRDPVSIDPITAGDYPELHRHQPDV